MSSTTTHVIFDFFGTLVDTMTPFIEVLKELTLQFGKEFNPEHCDNLVETETIDDGLFKAFNKLNILKDCEYATLRNKFVKKYKRKGLEFNPGVEEFVKNLRMLGIPIAIATNMKSQEFQAYCQQVIGFDKNLFSHVVCGGDDPEVKANKPSPDVFLVCMSRFKSPPKNLNNCVIFEDSIIGLKGAIASGMKTVLLVNKYCADYTDFLNGSTLFINSFENIETSALGIPNPN